MGKSSLLQKLHIKPGHRGVILNPPEGYLELLGPLPEGTTLVPKPGSKLDFVQVFVKDRAEVEKLAPRAIKAIKPDGLLWFSYPKKSSSMKSDISRDVGWDVVTGAGLECVSLVSIDDVWSAIRFRPVTK